MQSPFTMQGFEKLTVAWRWGREKEDGRSTFGAKGKGGKQMREFVDGLIGSMIDGCCSGLELPRKMFDFS